MTPTDFYRYTQGWLDAVRGAGGSADSDQVDNLFDAWEAVMVPPPVPFPPQVHALHLYLHTVLEENDDADHERSGAVSR